MKKNLVPAIPVMSWDKELTERQINLAKGSCHKISKKQMVKRILSFMKSNQITDADRKVFNKILGDTKLLNKLQICTDGSWLNGRIFYKNFFNQSDANICVDGEYWMQYYRDNNVSPDTFTKLNYMKYNFEVIYLHLVSNSREFDHEYHEENLLTNFNVDQLPIYEKALKDFGDSSLYITDQAYDNRGRLLSDYYSLRTKSNKDRSDFWKLFRGIRDKISA